MQEGKSWVANVGVSCFNDLAKAMLFSGISHTQDSCGKGYLQSNKGGTGVSAMPLTIYF